MFQPIHLQDTSHIRMLHTVSLNYTSYIVCEDVPYNTPAWCILFICQDVAYNTLAWQDALYNKPLLNILPYMSWHFHTIHTSYVTVFHATHPHDILVFYFVCHNVPYNTPTWYIPLCMYQCSIQYACMMHSNLYVRMFQTIYLHDASYSLVKVPYTITPCSISYFIMSAHCRQYSCMMHSTLYVWVFHTIYMQDTSYFVPHHIHLSRLPVSQAYANLC
jgi:hypothetical protein